MSQTDLMLRWFKTTKLKEIKVVKYNLRVESAAVILNYPCVKSMHNNKYFNFPSDISIGEVESGMGGYGPAVYTIQKSLQGLQPSVFKI